MAERWADGGGLRWLFLDLNSYFASVEQQDRPELRGEPVIVIPVRSEYTCAIAASGEAKAFGVKTGMGVKEARRLCPQLQVIDARPDRYVEVHHRIMQCVGQVIPVTHVKSIDECACELTGPERLEANAVEIGRRAQRAILEQVGERLTSSVGLGPTQMLAKTAADMKKPMGLTVLRLDALPGPVLDLRLKDFPGVGPNMVKRLNAAGVGDVAALWELSASDCRRIWGSVMGDRFWYALHGIEPGEIPTERSSIGHSHVLAKEARPLDKARLVVRRLAVKCGSRLRREGLKAGGISVTLDTEDGRSGRAEKRLVHTADTFALLAAVDELWADAGRKLDGARLRWVGVDCFRLVETAALKPDLFGWSPETEEDGRRMTLSKTLDALNQKFGKDAVTIGPKPIVGDYVGAKIAFNRVPTMAEFKE